MAKGTYLRVYLCPYLQLCVQLTQLHIHDWNAWIKRKARKLRNRTGMPRLVVRLASSFAFLSWSTSTTLRGHHPVVMSVVWLVSCFPFCRLSFGVCGLWTNIDIDVQGRAFFSFLSPLLFCLGRALSAYNLMYPCMYVEWCTSLSYWSLFSSVLSLLANGAIVRQQKQQAKQESNPRLYKCGTKE